MNYRIPDPIPTHRPTVVSVVAPSGALLGHERRIESGIRCLEAAGFTVRSPRPLSTRTHRGYLSASDDVRFQEMWDALVDEDTDIVWWARGGSGAARLLPRLLPDLPKIKPKWLVGFSDATSILNAAAISAQWVTIHGPTVSVLDKHPKTVTQIKALINNINHLKINPEAPRVYGGNLTVLASIMGTLDLDVVGPHHLLIEDVNEHPYRLDRALTQLRQSWPIKAIESIWVGDLDLEPDRTEIVIRNLREDFDCSIHSNAPAGHSGPLALVPLGLPVSQSDLSSWLTGLHR